MNRKNVLNRSILFISLNKNQCYQKKLGGPASKPEPPALVHYTIITTLITTLLRPSSPYSSTGRIEIDHIAGHSDIRRVLGQILLHQGQQIRGGIDDLYLIVFQAILS